MNNWHPIYHEIVNSLKKHPQGGLMILASGISIASVVSLFLTYFLERRGNLLFLVNFSYSELQLIDQQLSLYASEMKINNVNFATSISSIGKLTLDKRKQVYLSGGIIHISTQIFIQDILNGILEPKLITHLIIQRVHEINNKFDSECLLTSLIKVQNPRIFLLAISDAPQIIILKQSIETLVRHMLLTQIFPWAFNRIEIVTNCKQEAFTWKEHTIPLRKAQQIIQDGLVLLIEECVGEINRRIGQKDAIQSTHVLHCGKNKVVTQIRRLLVINKDITKNQLFLDIFDLKRMLFYLLEQKESQFYRHVQEVTQGANMESIYQIPDQNVEKQMQAILEQSKKRVYSIQRVAECIEYRVPCYGNEDEPVTFVTIKAKFKLQINLKANSKLLQICELLKDFKIKQTDENFRVWIWSKHIYNQEYIQTFLNNYFKLNDHDDYLSQMYTLKFYLNKSLKNRRQSYQSIIKNNQSNFIEEFNKVQKAMSRKQEIDIETILLHLMEYELDQYFQLLSSEREKYLLQITSKQKAEFNYQILPKQLTDIDITKSTQYIDENGGLKSYQEENIIDGLTIVVNVLDDCSSRTMFQKSYQPHFIIISDPSNSFLREILMEKLSLSLLEVHVLFYQNSIESQIFYKDKLDEDTAFASLIQQCSQMPQYNELPHDMIESFTTDLVPVSTRAGRGADFFQVQQAQSQPLIIVDFREFRSELPAQLYYAGFTVIPMMLKTGDYVLSNQVIVERKSVDTGDFNDSINSSRLEDQIKRMCQYEYPFLLIEYSARINFDLESLSRSLHIQKLQQESQNQQDTRSIHKYKVIIKLYELVSRYPKVQILWSKSAKNTKDIFKQLKKTIAQQTPDLEVFRKQQIKEEEILDLPVQDQKDDLESIVV